jgi:hypothetical protein
MTPEYTAPEVTSLGNFSELTLTPGNGNAFGKSSVTPDGNSGLSGNQSGG